MGASGASTGGGGGGVGPAGVKVTKTGQKKYGTAKDAKKVSRRNEARKFIREGGVTGKVISTLTGDAAKKANLKRRKEFIKKQGLTSDDIRMDDAYLSSEEGLKELKAQGYTTVADTSQDTRSGDQQIQPAKIQPAKIEPEPIIVKKNIGGTEVQTTDVKLAEEKKKKEEAEDEYDVRRTKRRGRRMTILTSQTGAGGNLVLGKPTLLGT